MQTPTSEPSSSLRITSFRLVLLDRDGVLNEDRPDSVKTPAELVMIPGAAAAVAALNRAGLIVALCSNQACIGRGQVSLDMLERIHDKLRRELKSAGAHLDAFFICPDAPRPGEPPSPRRKPAPGMLREAMVQFRISPSQTVMIGDSLSDLQAAHAAGVPRILLRSGKGAQTQAAGIDRALLPVSVHDNLHAAVIALLGGKAGQHRAGRNAQDA
jgi:D-glycero-D-manno-heptose 1,7-bisphosphate phosphatase